MNRGPGSLAVAALLGAIAVGIAWFGFDSRRKAMASLAEIGRGRAALATKIHAAEASIAQREREQAELGQLPAAPAVPPPLTEPMEKLPDEATVLAHNPELSALYAKAFRAGVGRRYGPIYQALGLPSDQVETLDELIAAQNLEKMKLLAAAESQGLDRSAPEVQALLQQLQEKYAAARGEIVGETANRQFDRLLGALPLMVHVNDIATYLAWSSTPLTGSQESQLLQVLGNASSLDPVTAQADPKTVRWGEALRDAQEILSASQLAALKVESQLAELVRSKNEFYQLQGVTK